MKGVILSSAPSNRLTCHQASHQHQWPFDSTNSTSWTYSGSELLENLLYTRESQQAPNISQPPETACFRIRHVPELTERGTEPNSVTFYALIAPSSLLQSTSWDYQHTSRTQGHICSSSSITAAYSSVSQQTFTFPCITGKEAKQYAWAFFLLPLLSWQWLQVQKHRLSI